MHENGWETDCDSNCAASISSGLAGGVECNFHGWQMAIDRVGLFGPEQPANVYVCCWLSKAHVVCATWHAIVPGGVHHHHRYTYFPHRKRILFSIYYLILLLVINRSATITTRRKTSFWFHQWNASIGRSYHRVIHIPIVPVLQWAKRCVHNIDRANTFWFCSKDAMEVNWRMYITQSL